MIPNYPYYGLPNYMNYFKNSSPAFNQPYIHNSPSHTSKPVTPNYTFSSPFSKNTAKFSNQPQFSHSSNVSRGSPIFNILGLNLYFDDLLILCLIFFLFSEKVNDYFLILILFLLLMD